MQNCWNNEKAESTKILEEKDSGLCGRYWFVASFLVFALIENGFS